MQDVHRPRRDPLRPRLVAGRPLAEPLPLGQPRDWVIFAGDGHLVEYCQPERYPDLGTEEWPGPDDAT